MRELRQIGCFDLSFGKVGDTTDILDSRGDQLFVGDVVIIISKETGTVYGADFVCKNVAGNSYVMGVANIWNSELFKKIGLQTTNMTDRIEEHADGWYIQKIKSYKELTNYEMFGNLIVQDLPQY